MQVRRGTRVSYPHAASHLSMFIAAFLGTLLLGVYASNALASEGNWLIGYGPVQKGQGGAGVASPHDASWMALNPATIVDLERRVDAYYEHLAWSRSLKPDGPPLIPVANKWSPEMVDGTPFRVPGIGLIWPLEHGTLGIGLFSTNGTMADYSRPRSILGFLRNSDRRSEQWILRLPVAYAYSFENGWALGIALNGNITRLRSDMATLRLRPASGDYEWDEALGFGFQFGVYKRWEKWGIGASYMTRQWVDDIPQYADLLEYNLDVPQSVVAGFAYRPIPQIEFVADYKFIDWSSVHLYGMTQAQGGLGWDDQHIMKLGMSWKVNDKWTLRSGYSNGKSPIDEDEVLANSFYPAIVEQHVTFGASYAVNDRLAFNAAYMRGFYNELTENGQGDIFSFIGKGTTISVVQNSFSLGFSYKF